MEGEVRNPKIGDSVGEGEEVWRPRPCAELEVAARREAASDGLGFRDETPFADRIPTTLGAPRGP